MFFYLSKILTFLISPTVLILCVMILALIVKKTDQRRKLFILSLGMLLFFSNPLIINQLLNYWESKSNMNTLKVYDAGIILSGFMSRNKEDGSLSFGESADRLTEGLIQYRKGRIKKIIISGGSGSLLNDTRESRLAKAFLIENCGVPDSVVLIDTVSRNTYENAVESKKIMIAGGLKSAIMITSAWHMRRAEGCFKKVGLDVDIHPTDGMYHSQEFSPSDLIIPNTRNIVRWENLMHEVAGTIIYKLQGYN
ncbi:MAG: YdcF family protein [Daejeonella sp.]|uniref:YdcF family protein n=1 Tax=Daejeonella sp. TaxID=2805397 RepID=UPI0027347524|nr:YdcF family protein [Daejeonella sp.]MDP3466846.1 YdcF family protein [Daejeonella sp.]